jgi:hypothetical protein
VQLDPPELGRVWIVVEGQRDALTARILAANETIREALDIRLPQLRLILESAGVHVQGLEAVAAAAARPVQVETRRGAPAEEKAIEKRRASGEATRAAPATVQRVVDIRV